MLRLINIIVGLSFSLSAFAAIQGYRYIKEEAVLQDVAVEPTNGGFNPDFRAYVIRGLVMVGSNSCFAQGLKARLEVKQALLELRAKVLSCRNLCSSGPAVFAI